MRGVASSARQRGATTWNGTSWSNGRPNGYKDARLQGTYNTALHGSFTCWNLYIENGILTITESKIIRVLGVLVSQNTATTFTILDKGEFALMHNDVDVTSARVTINKTFPNLQRLDYAVISSPISGIPLKSLSPGTLDSRFYIYNEESDLYNSVDPNNILTEKSIGYLIRTPNNFSSTISNWNLFITNISGIGSLNKGIISKTIFHSNKGYQLIGNPYSAKISLRRFFEKNKNTIELDFEIWDKTDAIYNTSYTIFNLYTSNKDNRDISILPFQGFVVKKLISAVSDEIIFSPEMIESHYNFTTPDRIYINLNQQNLNLPVDGICYDIKKFPIMTNKEILFDSANLGIKTNQNSIIKIKSLLSWHPTDIIPLYVSTGFATNYTITLKQYFGLFENTDIFLFDASLNITHNLKESDYTFPALIETFPDRFFIKFQP